MLPTTPCAVSIRNSSDTPPSTCIKVVLFAADWSIWQRSRINRDSRISGMLRPSLNRLPDAQDLNDERTSKVEPKSDFLQQA